VAAESVTCESTLGGPRGRYRVRTTIEHLTTEAIAFRCSACSHRWHWL